MDEKSLPLVILGIVALIAIVGLVLLFKSGAAGAVVANPVESGIIYTGVATSAPSVLPMSSTAYREAIGECPRSDVPSSSELVRMKPIYSCNQYCSMIPEGGVGYAMKTACTLYPGYSCNC